jgi:hypothetical protein
VVVAKPEALALVDYLIGLDHSYTPLPALPGPAAATTKAKP